MIYSRSMVNHEKKEYLLVVFITTCLFILPFMKKTSLAEEIPFLSQLDEIFIFLLLGYIITGYKILFSFRFGRQIILCFLLYLFLGVLSGIFNYVSFEQILFQVLLDLKFVFILLIFLSVNDVNTLLSKIVTISKVIAILSILLLFWQYYAPSSYQSFFLNGAKITYLTLPLNAGRIIRGMGIFWHPGELALFGSLLLMYFIYSFYLTKNRNNITWIFISGFLLISSCSRVEIAASIISIVFISHIYLGKHGKIFHFIILALILIILWPIIVSFLQFAATSHGIHDMGNSSAARTVFYYNSVLLAQDYFPLGSGFGSFGGQAAVVYDSELYSQLGFHQYYWYNERIYLTDTFWPHILGETGFIGAGVYGMILMIIATKLFNQLKLFLQCQVSSDWMVTVALAFGSYIVLIVNSLASANLSSTTSLIYGFFLISVVNKRIFFKKKLSN